MSSIICQSFLAATEAQMIHMSIDLCIQPIKNVEYQNINRRLYI